mmetsp:Transcript_45984/g.95661  ORF Transcript_45984/g.95661 Transcript_45984/m.95661 type:complete len:209 (+) Transcript_45984:16-642(+)
MPLSTGLAAATTLEAARGWHGVYPLVCSVRLPWARGDVALRLPPWSLARRPIEACGHALLDIAAELVHRLSVVVVCEPDLEADDIGGTGTRQLVNEAQPCDHVRWLDCRPDHAEDKIVPVLVDLPAADVGLQLELEVAPLRIHLVLPLGTNVVPEDHNGIDHVEAVGLLTHHALLLQQLAWLRHVVPQLPKLLHRAEVGHLVGGIRVL